MDPQKIKEAQSYLQRMSGPTKGIRYKIIVVKDTYFFFVDESHVGRYYEGGHKDLKGWYTGTLSFTREEPDILYVFISEILYDHVDATDLFLRILYQMLIYRGMDFFKLKYKKMRKKLHSYLRENLPKEVGLDDARLNRLLSGVVDASLYEEAEVVAPHMSLYNLIGRLPPSTEDILYISDIKSHLQPFEYMPPHHEEHQHRHHHH